jgi:hypothetical protein
MLTNTETARLLHKLLLMALLLSIGLTPNSARAGTPAEYHAATWSMWAAVYHQLNGANTAWMKIENQGSTTRRVNLWPDCGTGTSGSPSYIIDGYAYQTTERHANPIDWDDNEVGLTSSCGIKAFEQTGTVFTPLMTLPVLKVVELTGSTSSSRDAAGVCTASISVHHVPQGIATAELMVTGPYMPEGYVSLGTIAPGQTRSPITFRFYKYDVHYLWARTTAGWQQMGSFFLASGNKLVTTCAGALIEG